jgi:nucleotide-binding universal stress UspA family protein
MTYATVLVCLALDKSNDARLEVAGQLAERFEAGIVGIAAAQFAPPLYFTDGEVAQTLIDQGEASIRTRLSELQAEFRAAAERRSKRVEWRSAVDFPARFILQEARCADIIVSGGHGGALSDVFALASPKDLVMQAGRPLLAVPDGVNWFDLRSILVGWKDTSEARRAIADSLPLLRKAKEVTVVEVLERVDQRSAATSRVRDVVAWLSRHGVSAVERVSENDNESRDAGIQIDDIAGQVGAGLIVAGAYGHSRFRELVLGGMTEHLLTQSARCVLLSH